mmetsp:Transcript_13894/g.34206  ORF Transcript_13894/g.34206 Transcript_13894/m.34206 type:complete len:392 (+) Transcript_13894:123-1298(+)
MPLQLVGGHLVIHLLLHARGHLHGLALGQLVGVGLEGQHGDGLVAGQVAHQDVLLVERTVEVGHAVQPHVVQRLLTLVVPAQHKQHLPHHVPQPQEDGGRDAADDAVRDRVRERHHKDGEERGHRLAHVVPVHVAAVLHHQAAHQHDGGAGGVGRDGRKDGRQEHGHAKAARHDERGDAGAAALADAHRRLGKHGEGGGAQQRPNHDGNAVHHHGPQLAWPLALLIHEARHRLGHDARHGEHGGGGVQEVEVQEGDERHPHVALVQGLEVELAARLLDAGHHRALEEVLAPLLAKGDGGGRAQVGRLVVRDPRDEGDEQDADEDGRLGVLHHEQHHEHAAQDAQPRGGGAQLAAHAAVVGGARAESLGRAVGPGVGAAAAHSIIVEVGRVG